MRSAPGLTGATAPCRTAGWSSRPTRDRSEGISTGSVDPRGKTSTRTATSRRIGRGLRAAHARSPSPDWHHRSDEQVQFAPLPGDRNPAAGHALPDLPPHRRVPARQPHRGPDRALPPGPSRSARSAFPVTVRRAPALIPPRASPAGNDLVGGRARECQQSRRVLRLFAGLHV